MNRRDMMGALLAALAAVPGAIPISVYGQARPRRVALITKASSQAVEDGIRALHEGLKGVGLVDGRNFTFESHFGDYSQERLVKLATELIAGKPDIIVTHAISILTVAPMTRTIPIVAVFSGDMVDSGVVKSLARPGGNVTGVQYFAIELVGKRIEILKEIVPGLKRIAVLADPGHPVMQLERDASMKAAKQLGLNAVFYPVRNPKEELEAALAAARAAGAEALVSFPDSVTSQGRERIASFALQHKLPTVSGWESYALAGGLVTYGPNLRANWVRLASYVDRIFKGAAPESLPVELPTIIELVVNMKTARALGLKVPQSVLIRADRVIE